MEDRLLTVKEINELPISSLSGLPYPPHVAKAQDTKTAQILNEAHQKEIEEIFREIEEKLVVLSSGGKYVWLRDNPNRAEIWQQLKSAHKEKK